VGIVRRFARNSLQAEEAVHAALSKAWVVLGPGATAQEAKRWTMHVARNDLLTVQRDAARRRVLRPPCKLSLGVAAAAAFQFGLADVVHHLGDADREVFSLVAAGYSTREIAAERGVGERAVRKAIGRIRDTCALCGISPGEFRTEALGSLDDCECEA